MPSTHLSTAARLLPPAALDALSDALAMEKQLIDELTHTMLQQRAAVGVDDMEAVDDSVFATHRLLLTLGEARKRRRAINRLLGYDEELELRHLDSALGANMTPRLATQCEQLQEAARRLSREIDANRRVLREALATNETLARAVVPPSSENSVTC